MGVDEHRRRGPKSVGFAVITVSDTRTAENDETGHLLRDMLERAGHHQDVYLVVRDRLEEVQGAVREALQSPGVNLVLLNGGTGISKRDITVEALEPLIDKPLPGFGELFRTISFRDIGPAAMLSRALAGTSRDKLIIALPGSSAAARLATEKLILPELGHLIWEVSR
ncbi:MAG: MogA/MoaB family molybdenum cofactor biosynthesis protein [Thermoplasmata archaeon]